MRGHQSSVSNERCWLDVGLPLCISNYLLVCGHFLWCAEVDNSPPVVSWEVRHVSYIA